MLLTASTSQPSLSSSSSHLLFSNPQYVHLLENDIKQYEQSAQSLAAKKTACKVIEFIQFSLGFIWLISMVYELPLWATLGIGFGGAVTCGILQVNIQHSIKKKEAEYTARRTLKVMIESQNFKVPLNRECIELFLRFDKDPEQALREKTFLIPSKEYCTDDLAVRHNFEGIDKIDHPYRELERVASKWDLETFLPTYQLETISRLRHFSRVGGQIPWDANKQSVAYANNSLRLKNFADYNRRLFSLPLEKECFITHKPKLRSGNPEEKLKWEMQDLRMYFFYCARLYEKIHEGVSSRFQTLQASPSKIKDLQDQFLLQFATTQEGFSKELDVFYQEILRWPDLNVYTLELRYLSRELNERKFLLSLRSLAHRMRVFEKDLNAKCEKHPLMRIQKYQAEVEELMVQPWLARCCHEELNKVYDLHPQILHTLENFKAEYFANPLQFDDEKLTQFERKTLYTFKWELSEHPLHKLYDLKVKMQGWIDEPYADRFRKQIQEAFDELDEINPQDHRLSLKEFNSHLAAFEGNYFEPLSASVRYAPLSEVFFRRWGSKKKSEHVLLENAALTNRRIREIAIERRISDIDSYAFYIGYLGMEEAMQAIVIAITHIGCFIFSSNAYVIFGLLVAGYCSQLVRRFAANKFCALDKEKRELRYEKILLQKGWTGNVTLLNEKQVRLKALSEKFGFDNFEMAASRLIEEDIELSVVHDHPFNKAKAQTSKKPELALEITKKNHPIEEARNLQRHEQLAHKLLDNKSRLEKDLVSLSDEYKYLKDIIQNHVFMWLDSQSITLSHKPFCFATLKARMRSIFNYHLPWQVQFSDSRWSFLISEKDQFLEGLNTFKYSKPSDEEIEHFTPSKAVRAALKAIFSDASFEKRPVRKKIRGVDLIGRLKKFSDQMRYTPEVETLWQQSTDLYSEWAPLLQELLQKIQTTKSQWIEKLVLDYGISIDDARLVYKNAVFFFKKEQDGWEAQKKLFDTFLAKPDEKIASDFFMQKWIALHQSLTSKPNLKDAFTCAQNMGLGQEILQLKSTFCDLFMQSYFPDTKIKISSMEKELLIRALHVTHVCRLVDQLSIRQLLDFLGHYNHLLSDAIEEHARNDFEILSLANKVQFIKK